MDDVMDRTLRIDESGRRSVRLELETLRLRVLEGPDAGAMASFCIPVIRVGSAGSNDLVLHDDTVSRFHAEIHVQAGGLRLRDLDSTNGTFVGDLKVTEVELEPGRSCRFGATLVSLESRTEARVSPVGDEGALGDLVGRSQAMRDLYGLLRAVAPTDATVLVQGESGTGKELVARTLHARSGRAGPLVVFDAATTDPEMVRGDLFGHEKGAFTGAERPRTGAFRAADGGTLFLDEIGELPLDMQPRLLRVLETREVQPMGADRPVPVDVRVVAATHRDLATMVAEGRFREDLYHRLAVIPLRVPALRERLEDVPALIEHLLGRLGKRLEFSPEARRALETHPWPGNVRALRNTLERLAVLVQGRRVELADLALPAAGTATAPSPVPGGGPGTSLDLEEVERRTIEAALERCGGNRTHAARELGMSLATLKRRLRRYRGEA